MRMSEDMTLDPSYLVAAKETLDLIIYLCSFLINNQKIPELPTYLSKIEVKANARVSSSLSQTLGINFPLTDPEEKKPAKYWEGVRDMARYAFKQWNQLQDMNEFVILLENSRVHLLARAPREEGVSPLEEILRTDEFPDPKTTSVANSEIISIEEKNQEVEEEFNEQTTPQDTLPLDLPPTKPPPAAPSLPEKLLGDNDELLSGTLKEALKILRDEGDKEEN